MSEKEANRIDLWAKRLYLAEHRIGLTYEALRPDDRHVWRGRARRLSSFMRSVDEAEEAHARELERAREAIRTWTQLGAAVVMLLTDLVPIAIHAPGMIERMEALVAALLEHARTVYPKPEGTPPP